MERNVYIALSSFARRTFHRLAPLFILIAASVYWPGGFRPRAALLRWLLDPFLNIVGFVAACLSNIVYWSGRREFPFINYTSGRYKPIDRPIDLYFSPAIERRRPNTDNCKLCTGKFELLLPPKSVISLRCRYSPHRFAQCRFSYALAINYDSKLRCATAGCIRFN